METVPCPRCRAERVTSDVIIKDGYGVCTRCDTTWNRGSKNEMIAIPEEI